MFPQGVAAITTLPFVDELSQLQRIIALLQSATWAPLVPKLGLDRRLARLIELEAKYGAAVTPSKTVTFDSVKAARAKGQTLMLQVVAMVLGQYPSDSANDLGGRETLLRPILDQNAAIRTYLKEHRTVEDVDPKTGEIQPNAGPAGPTGTTGATGTTGSPAPTGPVDPAIPAPSKPPGG